MQIFTDMNKIYFSLILLFSFTSCFNLLAQDIPERGFQIVEVSPRFPGCEELNTNEEKNQCAQNKFLEHIYSKVEYPKKAVEYGIEGQVIIQFTIEATGEISHIEVVRTLDGGCTEAALVAVNSMMDMDEKWIPGLQDGVAVPVLYTLPIKFALTDDSKNRNDERITKKEKVVFKEADVRPRFPGCADTTTEEEHKICSDQKILKYVYGNLRYPALARKKGVEGVAVISFHVNIDGTVSNFELVDDPGAGCGKAALNVIESFSDIPGRWTPAVIDGENVNFEYMMPVKFRLH